MHVHLLQTFATMSSTEASTAGGLKRFRHITRPFLCTSMWLFVCLFVAGVHNGTKPIWYCEVVLYWGQEEGV